MRQERSQSARERRIALYIYNKKLKRSIGNDMHRLTVNNKNVFDLAVTHCLSRFQGFIELFAPGG